MGLLLQQSQLGKISAICQVKNLLAIYSVMDVKRCENNLQILILLIEGNLFEVSNVSSLIIYVFFFRMEESINVSTSPRNDLSPQNNMKLLSGNISSFKIDMKHFNELLKFEPGANNFLHIFFVFVNNILLQKYFSI